MDRQADLLEQARQALAERTGMHLDVRRDLLILPGPSARLDAIVYLPGIPEEFGVEIKRWAQHKNFGALVHQLRELHPRPLLVTDYVNPRMGERLIAEGIAFIDTVGNAFIEKHPVHIQILGNKPERAAPVVPHLASSPAFDGAGLKVVFALLCEPGFASAPYRTIADHSGVALGTVNKVIHGLASGGYMRQVGGAKSRKLIRLRQLMDRWAESYPEKLRPKLWLGNFQAPDPLWWQSHDLRQYGVCWGGEVAASMYRGFLKPVTATLYLLPNANRRFIANARLKKARSANVPNLVTIYRAFWEPRELEDMVHPILVYADLLATGDSRNREAAKDLYDHIIREHFGEAE